MNRGYGQIRLMGAVSSTVLVATAIGLTIVTSWLEGFPSGVSTFIWLIVLTLAGLAAIAWLIGLGVSYWARARRA